MEGYLLYFLLLFYCWVFFPIWTSEEIFLSDYIDYESAFLAGRALLSPYLYELAGEKTGNFCTVYCDMFVSLASSFQALSKPSLLYSSVLFEGGWQSKEVFYVKQSPATNPHGWLKQDSWPLTEVRCLCFRGPQSSFIIPMDSCVWVPRAARAFLLHFSWMNEVIAVHSKF